MGQRFIPAGKPSLKAGPRVPAGERQEVSEVVVETVKSFAAAPVKADVKPIPVVEKAEEPTTVETKVEETVVEEPKAQQPAETSRDVRKKKV